MFNLHNTLKEPVFIKKQARAFFSESLGDDKKCSSDTIIS